MEYIFCGTQTSFLAVLFLKLLVLKPFHPRKPLPSVQKRFNSNASLDGSLSPIYPPVLERPLTKCAQCILKQKKKKKAGRSTQWFNNKEEVSELGLPCFWVSIRYLKMRLHEFALETCNQEVGGGGWWWSNTMTSTRSESNWSKFLKGAFFFYRPPLFWRGSNGGVLRIKKKKQRSEYWFQRDSFQRRDMYPV